MINKNYRKKFMVSLAVMLAAGSLTACKASDKKENKNPQVSVEAEATPETSENAPNGTETSKGSETTPEATLAPAEETAEVPEIADAPVYQVSENDISYLKTYFEIEFTNDTVTAEEFNAALAKLKSEAKVEGNFTFQSAVKAAMQAANFEELVLSYPAEKTDASMKKRNIGVTVDAAYAPYIACAMDTGFLNDQEGKVALSNDTVTKEQAASLMLKIAETNGIARNYLGESDDPDIYGKVDNAWNEFVLFDDDTLAKIGKDAVQNKVVTGYNVKNNAYNANFLPELTLQYGHSDIKHAHQLIGLLNSEGIKAKVALEPKVSIYEYLLEWGPVPESTPTYEVKKFSDDLYLCYAVEYDMKLEFENKDELLRFDNVINTYAKKWEGNEEAKGLIFGSWWQPLYSATISDLPTDAYYAIGDCVINNGMYALHTFYLPKDKENVMSQMKKLAKDLDVTSEDRMVNKAFYNYLTGDDYQ